MSDLIEREAVLDLWERYHPYIAVMAMEFDHALRDIPTAETKKGRWIQLMDYDIDSNALFECSVCRGSDMHAMGVDVPYCWHCGARMEVDHETD